MSGKLVLRVASKAGRQRIETTENATWGEFQTEVAKRCGVEESKQSFKKDTASGPPCSFDKSCTMKTAAIKNGDQLFLTATEGGVSVGQDAVMKPMQRIPVGDSVEGKEGEEGTKDQNGANGYPSKDGAAASSSTGAAPKRQEFSNEPGKASHVSFEHFIRARRYDTAGLPLVEKYKPGTLQSGIMQKLPPSITLTHQKYRHVDYLEYMNQQEVTDFVKYWRDQLMMITQRVGWLYGYYVDDPNYDNGLRAVVEAIYEPPQIASDEGAQMLPDDLIENVDKIAEKLQLERIGWVFTSMGREYLLSAHEIEAIARLQLQYTSDEHYSGYPKTNFVTMHVKPDANTEPDTNAYMVSDQAMAMFRDDLVGPANHEQEMTIREPNKNELMPTVLATGKDTKTFDPDWFVVRVNDGAPKRIRSRLKYSSFHRENRKRAQTHQDIKDFLRSMPKDTPGWEHFSDFHLLIYIAKLFDVGTACTIAEAVANQQDIPDGVRILINGE